MRRWEKFDALKLNLVLIVQFFWELENTEEVLNEVMAFTAYG